MQEIDILCPSESHLSILHGDLTPANILIQDGGKGIGVRLIDFGDAGFGDPLFDLVPLHLVTFRFVCPEIYFVQQ